MAFLPQLKSAAQNMLLGLFQHRQNRFFVALRQGQPAQQPVHLLPGDLEGGHSELAVSRPDRRREDDEGVRGALGDKGGIIESGLAWLHWDGSGWVDVASLPGARPLCKREA